MSDELIEAMARCIHAELSRANVMAYLDMPDTTPETLARSLLPVIRAHLEPTSEMVEAARKQGQDEGFAAAVSWLRDRSAQKPAAYLALEAELLANGLENSRLPAKAWSQSNG